MHLPGRPACRSATRGIGHDRRRPDLRGERDRSRGQRPVRITDEAVEAVIRGYTRQAGVWDLAKTLGAVCAKVVRRRARGARAR